MGLVYHYKISGGRREEAGEEKVIRKEKPTVPEF